MSRAEPGTPRPDLSLVFPAFNEAENLPCLLESALKTGEQLGRRFEIVVVDDGSRDRTATLLGEWSRRDPRVRAVHHRTNRGYGAALRAGLREARGELVFFSDADLQFDLGEITALLAHADHAEIVAGYRAPRRDPWLRRAIAGVWGGLVRRLFDLPVRDIDCAFKVFRREVLDAIPIESIGAFVNTEILARARAAGFRIRQVPVSHRPRRSGRQSGAHPRVILRALIELSLLYRELHPARISFVRSSGNDRGRPAAGPSVVRVVPSPDALPAPARAAPARAGARPSTDLGSRRSTDLGPRRSTDLGPRRSTDLGSRR